MRDIKGSGNKRCGVMTPNSMGSVSNVETKCIFLPAPSCSSKSDIKMIFYADAAQSDMHIGTD
jgi:hypothetical protein